jgi:hypothetical protein
MRKYKPGICIDCDEPSVVGKVRCQKHLLQEAERAKQYRLSTKYKNYYQQILKPKLNSIKDRLRENDRKRSRNPKRRFQSVVKNVTKGYFNKKPQVWSIGFEDYVKLISQPCFYCEFPNNVETKIGLDKLDPKRGYELDNVVSCCIECNIVRGDRFSVEEMKRLGEVIKLIKTERQNAAKNQTTQTC